MFYKYELKNIDNQNVLFLYSTLKYEFSVEINNDNFLEKVSRDYIKINNINFDGHKIYFVVDGIIVKNIDIDDNSTSDEYLPDQFFVNIRMNDRSFSEITLRKYLINILLPYYNMDLTIEVLKSICILYNTYAYKLMVEKGYIDCKDVYSNMITFNRSKANTKDTNLINSIINQTAGVFLTYNGNYILPFIHYSNSGKTKSNNLYPYLSSVNCLWDLLSDNYINLYEFSYKEINDKLKINIDSKANVKYNHILNKISFNDIKYSVEEVKSILNLKSNNINIILNKENIQFITVGCGNSMGLSLYGAKEIEKNSGTCYDILRYFFPKVKICKYIKRPTKA